MAAQSDDHKMEGVEDPTSVVDKGKGKAPQAPDAMEESGDDDSSDESGPEDQVSRLPLFKSWARMTDLIAIGWRWYGTPQFTRKPSEIVLTYSFFSRAGGRGQHGGD